MIAAEAKSQSQVRARHAAARAAGGTGEGPHFLVGDLRNAQGNKIAFLSANPPQPGRHG
ncbi:hypothetical protein [Salipiger mangrovisoli]|uniref:Uncharacterized protein n=1 Tax=Salipiger mangrovisoli TaxID=2865933 RepID=A0ABR9X200_9RHOB|nr:hypothetical protein [Salipiger mangrovisoli]